VPDVRTNDARSVTIGGTRGEVLMYVAAHLADLDAAADRTGTPRPSSERDPAERLAHLEALLRTIRVSVQHNAGGAPSPHYIRAVASQAVSWLEELRERRVVSW
jgi:hypothetical protein